MNSDDDAHYTLQTDGTTKYGRRQHFATFDIATVDGTFSLGLRHVFSGSAQNTLETLLEIVDDLDVDMYTVSKKANFRPTILPFLLVNFQLLCGRLNLSSLHAKQQDCNSSTPKDTIIIHMLQIQLGQCSVSDTQVM